MNNAILYIEQKAHFRRGVTDIYFCGTIDNAQAVYDALTESGIEIGSSNPAELLYCLVEYIKRSQSKRFKNAIQQATEILTGQFSFIFMTDQMSEKLYCVNHGLNMIVGLDHNGFIIGDELSVVLSHTNRTISLEEGMMAEIFEDGTCLFTDPEGQRLNMEYRNVYNQESISPEDQIVNILKKELKGVITNVFNPKDLLTAQLNLS